MSYDIIIISAGMIDLPWDNERGKSVIRRSKTAFELFVQATLR